MKNFSIFLSVMLAFAFITNSISAAKPSVSECATIQGGTIEDSAAHPITLGYDQWGYNYEARMFNGWYDNYSRPTTPVTTGDRLMMKWNDAWLSNKDCDGDKMLDRHYGFATYIGSGAWLTNHYQTSYESTEYDWDLSGDWEIVVNGVYHHDYTFTMTSLADGTFTGVGGYPANASDYTFDEIVVNGLVSGNTVTFTASYYVNGLPTGYSWNATGTLDSNGAMINGTGTSGVTEWHSTVGSAKKVHTTCEVSDFVKIVAVPTNSVAKTEPNLYGEGAWFMSDGVSEIGPRIWGDFAVIQEVFSDPCGEMGDWNYRDSFRKGLGNW